MSCMSTWQADPALETSRSFPWLLSLMQTWYNKVVIQRGVIQQELWFNKSCDSRSCGSTSCVQLLLLKFKNALISKMFKFIIEGADWTWRGHFLKGNLNLKSLTKLFGAPRMQRWRAHESAPNYLLQHWVRYIYVDEIRFPLGRYVLLNKEHVCSGSCVLSRQHLLT